MTRPAINANKSQVSRSKGSFFSSQNPVSIVHSNNTGKSSTTPSQENKVIATKTTRQSITSPQFFAQLKKEERKQFTSKNRRRFHYKENYSAALSLPYSNVALKQVENDQSALLTLSVDNLLEHANRRVDLFFYTLIAYYKSELIPVRGRTSLQHGRGRHVRDDRSITEACHSSFTPSLVDSTIYQNAPSKKKRKGLLCGTHLMDNLNATVELPSFVNDLDDVLEKMCGNQCFAILRNVSLGAINPIEGLNQFLKEIQTALLNIKKQVETNQCSNLVRHSFVGKKEFNCKFIDLVLRGTLKTTFSQENQCVSDDYLQMLLIMTQQEKELCKKDDGSKETVYLKKIIEMQEEVLQPESNKPRRY